MANLKTGEKKTKAQSMGLHTEVLTGKTQQKFFNPDEAENFSQGLRAADAGAEPGWGVRRRSGCGTVGSDGVVGRRLCSDSHGAPGCEERENPTALGEGVSEAIHGTQRSAETAFRGMWLSTLRTRPLRCGNRGVAAAQRGHRQRGFGPPTVALYPVGGGISRRWCGDRSTRPGAQDDPPLLF